MPKCNTVLQSESDLFEPEIQPNLPGICELLAFIRTIKSSKCLQLVRNSISFTLFWLLLHKSVLSLSSQLPLYRSRRDPHYSFDITEFRYKGSYINGLEVLGENIHFDISGYFVISEFDIEEVDCSKTYNIIYKVKITEYNNLSSLIQQQSYPYNPH